MAKNKTGRATGPRTRRKLSASDVRRQHAAELPEREAMSLANINLALPINAAAALNVLSDGSIAAAAAEQTGAIDQQT